jgi:hypothetical protein
MANYETLAAFEAALRRAKSGLNDEVALILKEEAPDLANAVNMRVSTKGQKADGGNFSTPYSRSQKSKRQKQGNGSLGKQINYKGFYFKGTMWDSFGVREIKKEGMRVVASIGFDGSNMYLSNTELAKRHTEREKIGIANTNKEEEAELTRKIGLRIGQYLISVL